LGRAMIQRFWLPAAQALLHDMAQHRSTRLMKVLG
jgi:hypothetical protein